MIAREALSADDAPRPAKHSKDLERLTRLSRAFTYATSVAEMLELAVEQAAEMLGVERALLLLPDENGVLHVSASHGVTRELVERFSDSLNESLQRRLHDLLGAPMAEGFLGVPLVSNGNVIGLLAVFRPDHAPITEEEEWLLSAIADQVAVPLENARRAETLERAALVNENVRLLESERVARKEAEAALELAEAASRRADIARREAEVARDLAQEADRSKASFLAAMSHDLRTPLNAIAGYVELLRQGVRGPITENQAADLDRIRNNQQHLLSIVSEVLEFARMGAGRLVFHYEDVYLDSVLRDAQEMVMPQIIAKAMEFRYDSPRDPIRMRTDPGKVKQILLNILSNSIKFTPRGGQIHITSETAANGGHAAAPAAPTVRIRIADTGPGIPRDKLESVFLPFVQITRELNHPAEGIGLGLAISRDLARGLGGDLTAESEPGGGAAFTLTLPYSSSSE